MRTIVNPKNPSEALHIIYKKEDLESLDGRSLEVTNI